MCGLDFVTGLVLLYFDLSECPCAMLSNRQLHKLMLMLQDLRYIEQHTSAGSQYNVSTSLCLSRVAKKHHQVRPALGIFAMNIACICLTAEHY